MGGCACSSWRTRSRWPRAIARGLEAEGFSVDVVHDGDDGFARAQEHPYAAIVLDLLLPGMNGYKVARELRAAGNWTPILVLTAKTGEYDEAEALDTGADDFLSKPFSFVVLLARLRALLRRGSTPAAADAERRHASCSTRTPTPCSAAATEVHLTAREFGVLEALLRRQGGVASKQEILDEVWGADFPRRPQHRRGLHPLPPQEARRAVRARHDRDGPLGRLPGGARCLTHDAARRAWPWRSVRCGSRCVRHRPARRRHAPVAAVAARVAPSSAGCTDRAARGRRPARSTPPPASWRRASRSSRSPASSPTAGPYLQVFGPDGEASCRRAGPPTPALRARRHRRPGARRPARRPAASPSSPARS